MVGYLAPWAESPRDSLARGHRSLRREGWLVVLVRARGAELVHSGALAPNPMCFDFIVGGSLGLGLRTTLVEDISIGLEESDMFVLE